MEFTRKFSQLHKQDTVIAGGKGASLGEMFNAGIPVPNGFVVLSTAFDEFLRKVDLVQEIDAILESVDHEAIHSIDGASEKIQELIKRSTMPGYIETEIKSQFASLDTQFVAVRSSATAEDGTDHAWAGQLESYLNITEDMLLEKIHDCWASLFTPRAIFYKFEKGLHRTQISVAVVIQKMVDSEKSGIAFSVHPITEDRNQLIIEAAFGLGEAIVSGTISPDSYVVSKTPRKIIDINISNQNRALYRKKEGGNEWQDIKEKNGGQILTEPQIFELSDIILRVENHYGFPCDIEWAFENGSFDIVQSRPITTLKKTSSALEEYLSQQNIISIGKRRSSILQASIKINGWSRNLTKELGVGYELMIINSLGEQFVDEESDDKIRKILDTKDMTYAQKYVEKMEKLNNSLLEKIQKNKDENYLKEFSDLLAYFIIIRFIFERIYEKAGSEKQEYIEKWRNDPELFSSLDLYYSTHPQNDSKKEWSWVLKEGTLTLEDKILRYVKTNKSSQNVQEIRGRTAYPGIVSGRARVVLSKQERDSVEEGEIIIAPMTTVDFIFAMKKAAAFVTDEGGVTSHAAIVAREMKKPCIINTKIATQAIKTGDEIEVDANNGIVRKINTLP